MPEVGRGRRDIERLSAEIREAIAEGAIGRTSELAVRTDLGAFPFLTRLEVRELRRLVAEMREAHAAKGGTIETTHVPPPDPGPHTGILLARFDLSTFVPVRRRAGAQL